MTAVVAERTAGFGAPIGRIRSEVTVVRAHTGDTLSRTYSAVTHPVAMRTSSAPVQPKAAAIEGIDDEAVLARFAISSLAQGDSENTIELRTQTARKAARDSGCSVLMLNADQIRTFLAGYTNRNTKNTYCRSLRAFCQWAVAEGLRETDPMTNIRTPPLPRRVPRPCSTRSLQAMLDVATPRERAMLILAAYGGFRAADIAMIRGEDFDLDLGTVRVVGKGGVESVLPLPPELEELAAAMPAHGWWFPSRSRKGDHLQPNYICIIVRAVCKRAGVPLHGAHPLRHWFGTHLVRNGVDLRTVQNLMRHASLATTAGYVEVSDEMLRAAVLRLPRLAPPTRPVPTRT